MNFWKSKTIYRKIILILTAVHLLGCFIFPLAELRSGSSYLNQMMNWLGMDELPEHLSLFGLIRLLNSVGGSDAIFFTLTIVANVIILGILLIGKKRASYVVTLIIWAIFSIFEYPAMASAESTRVYRPVFWGGLQIAISVAISIVAILGIILEIKAQQKMAMKAAMASDPNAPVQNAAGSVNFKIDPEKMEKMKAQAGNFAGTSAAVAKKAAKVAVQGVYKATDAVKGFVEEAKNESGIQSQQKNVQMQKPVQNVQQNVAPQQIQQPANQKAQVQPTAPVQSLQQAMQMQDAVQQPVEVQKTIAQMTIQPETPVQVAQPQVQPATQPDTLAQVQSVAQAETLAQSAVQQQTLAQAQQQSAAQQQTLAQAQQQSAAQQQTLAQAQQQSAAQQQTLAQAQQQSIVQPQTLAQAQQQSAVQPQTEVQPQTLAQAQQQSVAQPQQVQPQAAPAVEEEYDDMKTVVLSQAAPRVKEELPQPKQIPQTGTITGIRGMFTGAQIPLASGEELIIGRSAESCHIILEGVEISRKHCVVMYDGTTGNYVVTDSSGNGTFTGDGGRLPVNRATALTPGTIICIGSDANAFKLGE